MLSAPSPSVHIPVQGVMGWGEVARSVGSGISSVILGSAALLKEKEQVTATGDLAEFSRKLHDISDETRARLAGREVQDWDYSWQQESAPRFAEAVAELPPAARQAGREFAEAYSRRASIQALRDREVEQLGHARDNWRRRVESAVQAGDAEQAERWLQSGVGVFVPHSELESERSNVRSRACAVNWRAALADSPIRALTDWAAAAPSALPQDAAELRYLKAEVERTRREATAALAGRLAEQVNDRLPYDEAELEQAAAAGLISPAQLSATRQKPRALKPAELCTWLRRVDELSDDPTERMSAKLAILTAPIPQTQRGELLQRLNLTATVAMDDRRTLSRGLWQLYSAGYLGRPGDSLALQRLAELQRCGLPVLAQEGSEAAARWVEHVRGGGDRWVCFVTSD